MPGDDPTAGAGGPAVVWFRRDLRLADHPALMAATGSDGRARPGQRGVVPLFVVDPALWGPSGDPRRAWLVRSMHALDDSLGGGLVVRHGDPAEVVPQVAREAGAVEVHVSADAGPYGRRRDTAVADALERDGARLVRTGSPYAVGPGSVLNGSGQPFKVYSAFFRAWQRHGWSEPAAPADGSCGAVTWERVDGRDFPEEPDLGGTVLPDVGEAAAQRAWRGFVEERVLGYRGSRDSPATAGTSAMSAHLKYGEVHPRTLLAELARLGQDGQLPEPARESVDGYRGELAWREFYADVLWHQPGSARDHLRPQLAGMRHDDVGSGTGARRFRAWQEGRTGFPLVDAGMRQLHAEAWVHNRVRMVVASFLVKDLHVRWQEGARYFMQMLRDGDLPSNQHGWQWVAGSGTDAAPYFRVFNPVTQGQKFDPDGDYVRRYVPELAHLPGGLAHTPWDSPDGYAHGYPQRIVDHAAERLEALARLQEVSA